MLLSVNDTLPALLCNISSTFSSGTSSSLFSATDDACIIAAKSSIDISSCDKNSAPASASGTTSETAASSSIEVSASVAISVTSDAFATNTGVILLTTMITAALRKLIIFLCFMILPPFTKSKLLYNQFHISIQNL